MAISFCLNLFICYSYNEAYLLTMAGKTLQFINLFNNNVSSPVNSLLAELLVDENFVDVSTVLYL